MTYGGAMLAGGAEAQEARLATEALPSDCEDGMLWDPARLVAIVSLGLAAGGVLAVPGATNSAILAAL